MVLTGRRQSAAWVCACSLIVSLAVVFVGEAAEPPAPAKVERIARLVKQLGHDECRMRDAASRELADVGIEASAALKTALEDPDLEIRLRAQELLSTVLSADFDRRLKEFAADVEDKQGLDLPGWKLFQKTIGKDAAARALFVSMQRAETLLMQEAAKGPKQATEALTKRLEQIQTMTTLGQYVSSANKQMSFERISALLYVASDPEQKPDAVVANAVGRYLYQSTFVNTLTTGDRSALAKKIFARWLSHPVSTQNLGTASQTLNLAMQHNMKEALPCAALLLQQQTNAYYKQSALLAIAKLGGKEQLPVLEPLLKETAQCGNLHVAKVMPPPMIQVRDIALAVTIHLSGKDPKEFGFEFLQKQDQTVFQAHTLGFADEKRRDEAFQKWADQAQVAKP